MTQQIRSRTAKNNFDHVGTIKYINLLLHIDIHLQRVKYIINEQSMNKYLSSFLFFRFPSNWERERVYKIGYKEKQSQGYLSYLDGFLWRIFPLLWANRLYAIFNTGLKKMASSCPRYSSSSFTRSTWLWFCPLRTLSNNWLSYYLFPLTGRSPHFRFRVPANHLASLSFSLARRSVRATICHPSQVTEYR